MGLIDTQDEAEEEENEDNSGSGTYIHFISGPGHRDWKEKWEGTDAESDIPEAYKAAAPNADSVIPDSVTPMWEDRDHFYADLTIGLRDAFEDNDFQHLLDLLFGGASNDEVAELYADQLAEYLENEPKVAEKLLERANQEPAPADD